jgi:hypothetical protein
MDNFNLNKLLGLNGVFFLMCSSAHVPSSYNENMIKDSWKNKSSHRKHDKRFLEK